MSEPTSYPWGWKLCSFFFNAYLPTYLYGTYRWNDVNGNWCRSGICLPQSLVKSVDTPCLLCRQLCTPRIQSPILTQPHSFLTGWWHSRRKARAMRLRVQERMHWDLLPSARPSKGCGDGPQCLQAQGWQQMLVSRWVIVSRLRLSVALDLVFALSRPFPDQCFLFGLQSVCFKC